VASRSALHGSQNEPAAPEMNFATVRGWALNAVWDPLIVSMVAFARSAVKCCTSGGIERSCSEIRNQDGSVVQPAALAFSVQAAPERESGLAHQRR
jgi:hypothetical protein